LTIAITLDDPDRASTQLVTELMIMSGEGMAKLGRASHFYIQVLYVSRHIGVHAVPRKWCSEYAMHAAYVLQ
jgi:hypothetical protein